MHNKLMFVLRVLFGLTIATTLSCTREVDLSLNIKLSAALSGNNSGLSGSNKIVFAVINFQQPGKIPFVKEFDFHDQQPSGSTLDLVVDNIQLGAATVQFLGVYQNQTTGLMRITYGDKDVNISGVTNVSITPSEVGTITKEAQIAGRYITNNVAGNETGPTGTLVMQYQPPNGKPKMNMSVYPMVNGWFKAMAVDGVNFDFSLLETGETIFQGLSTTSTMLAPSNSLLKIIKPTSYRNNHGTQEISGETEYYLGFFKPSGVSYANTKYACHPEIYSGSGGESLMGETHINGAPIDFCLKQGNGCQNNVDSKFRISLGSGSGIEKQQEVFYKKSDSTCNDGHANASSLQFYHVMLHRGTNGVPAGLKPPFMIMNPFESDETGYLTTEYVNLGTPTFKLKWRFVPDIDDSIDGVEVFAKYHGAGGWHGGGGGGHEMQQCNRVIEEGYVPVTTIAYSASPNYMFDFTSSHNVNGTTLSQSNKSNWGFAVCAYKMQGTFKKYIGEFIKRDCNSGYCGSESELHYGWAETTKASSVASPQPFSNFGASARVTAIDSLSFTNYTQLTFVPTLPAAFTSGAEVMLHLVGKGTNSTGDCGTFNGDPLQIGQYKFTRVIGKDTDSFDKIYIPKGTFVDAGHGKSDYSSSNFANMCYLQAIVIPHYNTFTFTNPLYSYIFPAGFDFASDSGGGVAGFRVNGTTTFNDATGIDASGAGFAAGDNTNPNGFGPDGSASTSMGGQGSYSGNTGSNAGGGGGAGLGSSGASNAGGGGLYRSGGFYSGGSNGNALDGRLGAGGGAGYKASSPDPVTSNGGQGAGIAFIFSKKVALVAPGQHFFLKADGKNAPGSQSVGAGGGGGAGYTGLFTEDTTGLQGGDIVMSVKGGNGGNENAVIAYGGGAGGAGKINAVVCDLNNSGSATNSDLALSAPSGSGWSVGMNNGDSMPGYWRRSSASISEESNMGGAATVTQNNYNWFCGAGD